MYHTPLHFYANGGYGQQQVDMTTTQQTVQRGESLVMAKSGLDVNMGMRKVFEDRLDEGDYMNDIDALLEGLGKKSVMGKDIGVVVDSADDFGASGFDVMGEIHFGDDVKGRMVLDAVMEDDAELIGLFDVITPAVMDDVDSSYKNFLGETHPRFM